MLPEGVTVRQLAAHEWSLFRDMRLLSLQFDPNVFSSRYEMEAAYPDEEWQKRLANPDLGVFCAFFQGQAIGLTGIRARPEEGFTANLWGSWLESRWRRKGISRAFYESRIDWARNHPGVKRIIVSHRESNLASMRANQKHGFVKTHETSVLWSDGRTENDIFYELHVDGDGC